MAAGLRPDGTKAYRQTRIILVKDATYDPNSPSLAKLTGASALDVTNMFYESSASPRSTTNLVTAPRRVGDGASYQRVGTSQEEIGEVRYSFDPQAAALSNGKKCFEFLPELTTGYYVTIMGLPDSGTLAVGAFATSRPFEAGSQDEVPEGDGEAAEVAIAQTLAATGPKSLNKAIVT
ncbi:hypothetical protein J2X46_002697 [Nocardioides sp. BE266]|uniref:phage tail tube protein n=1 Tax=Nocardioides sp. BE266 TaxID=2817725 RepID=UPI0028549273|nr:hypothetical protein [Nocardioides sp. BE266]MDR7253707.1 hypothetical protein [Nocardioides sp. BE266]